MKPLFLFLFLFLFPSLNTLYTKVDLFSKVTITSKRAVCKKNIALPHTLAFHYLDNVIVTFADGTTISADMLEIIFDDITQGKKQPQPTTTSSNTFANHFKKVEFTHNVRITSNGRLITANKGIFNIPDNTCLLEGNVFIKQSKIKKSDIPVTVQSARATLNLTTMETALEGSGDQPVSTCFVFENNAKDTLPHEQNTITSTKRSA